MYIRHDDFGPFPYSIVPCWRYLLGFTDSATQSFTLPLFPDYTVGIASALLQPASLSILLYHADSRTASYCAFVLDGSLCRSDYSRRILRLSN
jgi:hypothetical protein